MTGEEKDVETERLNDEVTARATGHESSNLNFIRLISLSEACLGQDPLLAIRFLYQQHYYDFFVEVPRTLSVWRYMQHEESVAHLPSRSHQVSRRVDSVSFVQIGWKALEELLDGEPTNVFEFGACALAKKVDRKDESPQFLILDYGMTFLRPMDAKSAPRIPLLSHSTTRSHAAKSTNPATGDETFLIANLSVGDLFIVEGSLLVNQESTGAERLPDEQVEVLRPGRSDSPRSVEDRDDRQAAPQESQVLDPLNFAEHCPAVYLLMQIAKRRIAEPKTDAVVLADLSDPQKSLWPVAYATHFGNDGRKALASHVTRANFTSNSKIYGDRFYKEPIDDDPFIREGNYSHTLQLILSIAKRWVQSDRSDEQLRKILRRARLESEARDDFGDMMSWLILGKHLGDQPPTSARS